MTAYYFEQIKQNNSHLADFEQVKINSPSADFEQIKN